jgi:hypothetical protein
VNALTFPTIHINGSSVDRLIEDYAEIHHAIHNALEKMQAAGPNGRDYYPQGDEAFAKARQEHRSRMTRLVEVNRELRAIIENIQEQDDARKARR